MWWKTGSSLAHRRAVVAAGVVASLLVASTVLAGTGYNGTFNLGVLNTVNGYATKLTGALGGTLLQVTNTSTSTSSVGLGVRSQYGTPLALTGATTKPPMTVNSSVRVLNLNADRVDGKHAADFLPVNGKAAGLRAIHYANGASITGAAGQSRYVEDRCPAGTLPVSGSFSSYNAMITPIHSDTIDADHDGVADGWAVEAYFRGADTLFVFANCIAASGGIFEPSDATGGSRLMLQELHTRTERLDQGPDGP